MTTDPLALLRSWPPDASSFGDNRSSDPAWVTDGDAMISAERAADAALLRRLARSGPRSRRWAGADRLGGVLRHAVGAARWPVAPSAVWARGGATYARWALPDGRPVADVNAAAFRLADACLGGWDEATWNGEVPWGPVVLWRRGRPSGVLAAVLSKVQFHAPPLEPVGPAELLAGADPDPPPPPWAPRPLDVYVEGGFELACEEFGGRRDARRGFAWALPTRGGTLRVRRDDRPWYETDRSGLVFAAFDDPLAAARVIEWRDVSPLSSTFRCNSTWDFWNFLVRGRLGLAPDLRAPAGDPPPLFGDRYATRARSGGHGLVIWDGDVGAPLRGAFHVASYARAEALADRVNAARGLALASRATGAR